MIMGKKKELDGLEEQENNEPGEVNITPEIAKKIEDLIFQQKQMAVDKEAFSEAATAIADQLGIKPAVLKRRVTMIIKEEDEGGELKSKSQDINFAEKYWLAKDNNKHK